MQSNQINHRSIIRGRDITFSDWVDLGQAVDLAPKTAGIYVMKSANGNRFGRVREESAESFRNKIKSMQDVNWDAFNDYAEWKPISKIEYEENESEEEE